MNEYHHFYQQKLENEKKLIRKELQLSREIDQLSIGGELSNVLTTLIPLENKRGKTAKKNSPSNQNEGNILEQSIDLFQNIQHTALLIRKFFRQFSTTKSE